MHQHPEMSLEERLDRLERDIGFLIQAQRLFAQTLGVHDQFELLAKSLERHSDAE